jgi:hypothetical protein
MNLIRRLNLKGWADFAYECPLHSAGIWPPPHPN